MSKTPIIPNPTISDLELEHQRLHSEHEVRLAELAAKKEAIVALRAPVVTMLAERSDLRGKLAQADDNRVLLENAVTRWQNWQDEVWSGDESAREFMARAGQPLTDYLGAAGLVECRAYIGRTQTKLDALDAKLTAYTTRHGLQDMLA